MNIYNSFNTRRDVRALVFIKELSRKLIDKYN